ncbi:unnamed protein product [Rotaria magnacalcarata]
MSFPFLLLFRRSCSINSAIESSGGGGRRSGKFTVDETSLFLFSLPVRLKPKKEKKKSSGAVDYYRHTSCQCCPVYRSSTTD